MKNKNSYEVLEAEVAKLKEENRHLKDERDELKYMLNDMHRVLLMLQMMTFSMKCQDCAVVLKSKVQESQQRIRI